MTLQQVQITEHNTACQAAENPQTPRNTSAKELLYPAQ